MADRRSARSPFAPGPPDTVSFSSASAAPGVTAVTRIRGPAAIPASTAGPAEIDAAVARLGLALVAQTFGSETAPRPEPTSPIAGVSTGTPRTVAAGDNAPSMTRFVSIDLATGEFVAGATDSASSRVGRTPGALSGGVSVEVTYSPFSVALTRKDSQLESPIHSRTRSHASRRMRNSCPNRGASGHPLDCPPRREPQDAPGSTQLLS